MTADDMNQAFRRMLHPEQYAKPEKPPIELDVSYYVRKYGAPPQGQAPYNPPVPPEQIYAPTIGLIRETLPAVSPARLDAFRRAHTEYTKIDNALRTVEQELQTAEGNRPSTLDAVDDWSVEVATLSHRREALVQIHSQAATTLHTARTALHAAIVDALNDRSQRMQPRVAAARKAAQEAKATLERLYQEQQTVARKTTALRDAGPDGLIVSLALKEVIT